MIKRNTPRKMALDLMVTVLMKEKNLIILKCELQIIFLLLMIDVPNSYPKMLIKKPRNVDADHFISEYLKNE